MASWLPAAGKCASISCDTSGVRAVLGVGLRSRICYPEGVMQASVVDHVAPSGVCKGCLVSAGVEVDERDDALRARLSACSAVFCVLGRHE